MRSSIALGAAALMLSSGACRPLRPPVTSPAAPPAPAARAPEIREALAPAAAPPSDQTATEIVLPTQLGPPQQPAPDSLEVLMAEHGLAHAKAAVYEKAFAPLLGAKVHWQLHSWGGEVSSVGYVTPSGSEPPRAGESQIGRTRLISRTLGDDADLWTVIEEGWPVVVCLARHDLGQPKGQFIRDDDSVESAPLPGENVTLEGTLWGVLAEGDDDSPTIWLHNCAVTATTEAGPARPRPRR